MNNTQLTNELQNVNLTCSEQVLIFRTRKKLSQSQLAHKAKLSRATISLIERNLARPEKKTLDKLWKVLSK